MKLGALDREASMQGISPQRLLHFPTFGYRAAQYRSFFNLTQVTALFILDKWHLCLRWSLLGADAVYTFNTKLAGDVIEIQMVYLNPGGIYP